MLTNSVRLLLISSKRIAGQRCKSTGNNASLSNNFFKKLGFLTGKTAAVRLNGFVLYESVADKVNYSPFLKGCQMPDTFYSWFTVTELHVWMLLVRAMDIPDDGRFLRNMIVEAMWNDVQTRSKKLEGTGSARREQVSELGDQFTAALLSYDEGLLGSDIDLANALWRTLFQKNDVHPHALEAAVHLVRKQVQLLDEIDDETFLLKGGKSIAWCELPLPKTS